jgi:hypothetical protein
MTTQTKFSEIPAILRKTSKWKRFSQKLQIISPIDGTTYSSSIHFHLNGAYPAFPALQGEVPAYRQAGTGTI